MFFPYRIEERMCYGFFYRYSLVWIESQQPIQQIVKFIVITLNIRNLFELMLLNILRQLEFITQVFTLFNNFTSEKVSQLNNIVDIVTIFYVVWFVDHADIIENVVFPSHEL